MKKRLLSSLLALCMVLSLLPGTTLAVDTDFVIEDGILTEYKGPGWDVVIPDGVTSIGNDAFSDCESLTSVIIPDCVTVIKMNAFGNRTGLTDVYYGGDEAQWEAIAIDEGNESLAFATIHYDSAGAEPSTPFTPAELKGAEPRITAQGNSEESALAALLSDYIQSKRINGGNISIAYYNTVSGEEVLWNGDTYFTAASIYKLPLNMYYYELEAAGEISPDTRISGYTLAACHQQSLQYSNNPVSQVMRARLGTYQEYKALIAKYGGIPEESFPEIYYSGNYFNTAFILNTLKILYAGRDGVFAQAIQYLKDAHPGQWFETKIPDSECTIAQKYGWLSGSHTYAHTAGIVYADEPFLLVVFTQDVGVGEKVPGEIARICYDYTQANVGTWRETVLNFEDVYTTDWYADAVAYCAERGIVKGTSGTTFSPNNALTRAMFVTMLGRFSGVNSAGTFADVNYGDYYSLYVEWAYQNGIASGVDGVNFAPNEPITREQAAVMLYRCLNVLGLAPPAGGGSLADFRDAGQISNYAKEAADALYARGIFAGDNNGRFNPRESLTRAQAAALFMRVKQ